MREILLVEDSENDARLLKRALQAAGIRNPIHHARTGKEALTWLEDAAATARKEFSPVMAVVFLDLKLPDLSGFEILRRINEEPALTPMLRIVLSQMEELDAIRRAYSLGAHTFLSKPATEGDLQELIQGFPDYWVVGPPSGRSSGQFAKKNLRSRSEPQESARKKVQQVDGVPQGKFLERGKRP